jgi:hypothetical protein
MDAHTIDALKNRIILLEKRLAVNQKYCADLYLKCIVKMDAKYSDEYEEAIEKMLETQNELKLVRSFLN